MRRPTVTASMRYIDRDYVAPPLYAFSASAYNDSAYARDSSCRITSILVPTVRAMSPDSEKTMGAPESFRTANLPHWLQGAGHIKQSLMILEDLCQQRQVVLLFCICPLC